ncbi:MAG: hypothetical protein CMI26_10845 [Opitutae bacterium]|nr:hypothetical protein [Opitutae bacterium]|tara:strand:+ start:515 stop:1300 length:786 start_codon:yes stop_codon:yes gene_type:complete
MRMKRNGGMYKAVWLFTVLVVCGCISTKGPEAAKELEKENATVVVEPFLKEVVSEDSESAKWKTVYDIDFSGNAVGEEPEELFILDGSFSVQQEEQRKSLGGNMVLSLPGTPVGDFGFLFGPRVKGKPVELRCRVFSTRKGRRMPTFAAGLGGVNGYRLRLNAAARNLQLVRGEETLVTVPYVWSSGKWTNLTFRAESNGNDGAIVSAKVWSEGGEPEGWSISHQGNEAFAGGKCSLWGLPYASSEILFDDLKVLALEASE